MPKYKITNNQTGETLVVSGDKAPSQSDVQEIFASRTSKTTTNQQNPNLLQSIYNLTAKPVVEGAKSYGELVGSAGLTVGSALTRNIAPELSSQMANKALDIRQKTGLTGSFDQGTKEGLTTVATGALKGAAGVGAAADIGAMLMSGGLSSAAKIAAKETVRNAVINAGLYGTGEALESNRKGENVVNGFMRGLTGGDTTGIFEGISGDNETAKAADLALSVGLPILLGRQIDKVTNKIVDIGSNGAKTAVNMVKNGVTTPKIASNLKKWAGDQSYNAVVDDIEYTLKSTKSGRSMMDKTGSRLGEEYLVRGLSGKFDKDSINSDIKKLWSDSDEAGKSLKQLASDYGYGTNKSVDGLIYEPLESTLYTKNDLDSLVERLKQGKDLRDQKMIDSWYRDLPNKNLSTMDDILEAERLSGSKAFTKSQSQKDQVLAKAYGALYRDLRDVVTTKIPESKTLFEFRNTSKILADTLQNTKVSAKPKDLSSKIGSLFSPRTLAQKTVGQGIESVVKGIAGKTSVPNRIQQSPAGIRQSALQGILNETKSNQTPQLSSLRVNPLEGIKNGL